MTGTPEQESTASTLPVKGAPRLGFAKGVHLRKRADFERVYQLGRRHFSQHLTVFFRRREASEAAAGTVMRVGFTVGRALGGAVERNRIKRRLREAARHEQAALITPVDVVIHPKKSVLTVDFAVLRSEMAATFAMVEQGKGAPPQPRREPRATKSAKAKTAGKAGGSVQAKPVKKLAQAPTKAALKANPKPGARA